MRYRAKHVVEYAALRCFAGLVNMLPYRAALALGWVLAVPGHFVFRFRASATRDRIRQVFGDTMPPGAARRVAWQAWLGVLFTAIEALRLPRVGLDWALSVCDCTRFLETLREHAASGRGAVLACPHTGSWELAAVTSRLAGVPIFSVAAAQKNPLANAYLDRLRRSAGAESIARGSGTMKQVVRRLREGGMLAILPDVRAATPALDVPFLGGKANVGKGMASFARTTDTPIFVCIPRRTGFGRHTIDIHDPIRPDQSLSKADDLQRMTEAVFAIIDEAVRREPGQWFWYNKRWILDPLD